MDLIMIRVLFFVLCEPFGYDSWIYYQDWVNPIKLAIIQNAETMLFDLGYLRLNGTPPSHFSMIETLPSSLPRYDLIWIWMSRSGIQGYNYFTLLPVGKLNPSSGGFSNGLKNLSLRYISYFHDEDVDAYFGIRVYSEWIAYVCKNCFSSSQDFIRREIIGTYNTGLAQTLIQALDIFWEESMMGDFTNIPSGVVSMGLTVLEWLIDFITDKLDPENLTVERRRIRQGLEKEEKRFNEMKAKGQIPTNEKIEDQVVMVRNKVIIKYANTPNAGTAKYLYPDYPYYVSMVG